jgi:hypothetical protein
MYTVVSLALFTALMAYVFYAYNKSKEHFYQDDVLTDTEINIIIVRSYNKIVERFPSSDELVKVLKWVKANVAQHTMTDRVALKTEIEQHVQGETSGVKAPMVTLPAVSAPTAATPAHASPAVAHASPDVLPDVTHASPAVLPVAAPTIAAAPSVTAASPSAHSDKTPSYAPAVFKEFFVGDTDGDTVSLGLSVRDVGVMHDKVSEVLSSLGTARTAMKLVAKDDNTVIPIPVSREDLRNLRDQVKQLSEKLVELETKSDAAAGTSA